MHDIFSRNFFAMTNALSFERYSKQDIRLAKARCLKMALRRRIALPELDPTCVLSVIIPVYDEHVSRLRRQIESFNKQVIDPKLVEVVYIVNNPKCSKVADVVLKHNGAALNYLKKAKSKIKISVIDASSKNRELEIGNVGEARNIAIHAVTSRYLAQKRDGILLQTDADTLTIKANHFKNIIKEVTKEKCVGASGGVRFILSMDSRKSHDHAFYAKHLKILNQYVQWNFLMIALHRPGLKAEVTPTRFSGANTVTLAIASICAGGVPPLFGGSDFVFSYRMDTYAKKHGYHILPRRDQWIMSTSFRESKRTKSSMGRYFETMKTTNGQPMVRSRYAPSSKEFIAAMIKDTDALLPLVHDEDLRPAVEKLVRRLKKIRGTKARLVYTQKAIDKEPKLLGKFFGRLHLKEYPLVPLTTVEFKAFKKMIYSDPQRRPFAENAIKYFATFHLN